MHSMKVYFFDAASFTYNCNPRCNCIAKYKAKKQNRAMSNALSDIWYSKNTLRRLSYIQAEIMLLKSLLHQITKNSVYNCYIGTFHPKFMKKKKKKEFETFKPFMHNVETVCSCHVTYAFECESTLYSCHTL